MSEDRIVEVRNGSSWQLPAIIVLGLVALGGLAFGYNASSKLDTTQQAVATQLKTTQQSVQQDMSSLKDRLAQDEKANTDLQGDLKVITGKLKITQGQLRKAREEAAKLNDATVEKVSALDTSVHSELATKATNDDVKTVDTKVVGVKTDLDATREDLKMARSEMGTLIARNHDEIDQLRRLGERDYVEFTIVGKNKPQKVGNVTVELKGVNEKRNQFSAALTIEDKQFEKKNRAMNEPIFFYTSGTHIPEEVVINKVGKNTISGYVSIPKANSQVASTGSEKSACTSSVDKPSDALGKVSDRIEKVVPQGRGHLRFRSHWNQSQEKPWGG
jgi:vacuolar-type H+-ATPase subunit I/STV1